MNAKLIVSVILISTGLCACTNPMDKKITRENFDSVVEDTRKKASPEDWKKVEAILMMAKFARMSGKTEIEVLEGKSFNHVIENIKNKNQADAKAAQDEKDHSAQLSNLIDVVSWTKGNHADDYGINKEVRITMEISNKAKQDIDAFEGYIVVFDKLNNELAKIGIKETDVLKTDKPRKLTYTSSTIDFRNKMQEIYDTNGKDLKFKFEPTKLLMKDGTTL